MEKDDQLQVAKEKLKTIAARSVEAFQQTEEYATVLLSWYFKGFELLRRYLVKHPTGVDLLNLDLEVVDQEMTMDEAAQSLALEGDAPEKTPGDDAPSSDAPAIDDPVVMPLLMLGPDTYENFLLCVCPLCFGLFVHLTSQ